MRDAFGPLRGIVSELTAKAPDLDEDTLLSALQVEMLLQMAETAAPRLPAGECWALLSGYPFAQRRGAHEHAKLLRIARYWLWPFRSKHAWLNALENYNTIAARLRCYDVVDPESSPQHRDPSVAPHRRDLYATLLTSAPPFEGKSLEIASPGAHRFVRGRELLRVSLPDRVSNPVAGHDIDALPSGGGAPLLVSKKDLMATAGEMDKVDPANWKDRLDRVDFLTPQTKLKEPADSFTISGIMHMAGMVGAGKSTLRDVLAVHLAKKDHQVTLVVGDVAEVLSLVELFTKLKIFAAPVIGASTRERHIQRMHRRMATSGEAGLLAHESSSFSYLSTTCFVSALVSDDIGEPLGYSDAPCSYLGKVGKRARTTEPTTTSLPNRRGCPFWSDCPRHLGYRELVEAKVWVATPASLISSSVPLHQNAERIRYLELACRRSDLIIIDEVDRVQQQLDQMFAPAITLTGQGVDSWLDRLGRHKIEELARRNRTQLLNRDVENWSGALNTVQAAADRLHAMLVQQEELREWVHSRYFNALMLQQEIAFDWFPKPAEGPDELAAQREGLMRLFGDFRENPLGDKENALVDELGPELGDIYVDLVAITHELIHTTYPRRTHRRVMRKLVELAAPFAVEISNDELEQQARRLAFVLVLSALERRLALITAMWMRVEAALNLDSNQLYRRPPLDYGPVVAEAPMGNVLGFQFHPHGKEKAGVQSGELRFFRCTGVGRDLLTRLHTMPHVDGRPGPNVLLLSGTSWAGTSTRYHVDVPVGVVLAAPAAEVKAIENGTVMRFKPVQDENGNALRLSGADKDDRPNVLLTMARHLGSADEGELSPLEEELRSIADDRRRRILLLVGSYDEAELVADELNQATRWKGGSVVRLVSDDAEVELTGMSGEDNSRARVLRRGDVRSLADTGAEILVAPLLALERGHNILNEKVAAIGSVYFLARPNPRPDDLVLAVHAVNDWAIRAMRSRAFDEWCRESTSLGAAATEFRDRAKAEWRRVIRRSLAWSRLGDDRETVTWDMLVMIWQVIGRAVRGGVPARVTFVDAAFAPKSAVKQQDTAETSLLHSMRETLRRHCGEEASEVDRRVAELLYSPLLAALDRFLSSTTT